MIRSLSLFALFCCILGNSSLLNAQAGDSTINFSVIKLEPCRYRLFVSNTSPDCFNAATLLLQAGYYTGFMANSADGWVVEQLSSTELLLTHSNGLFPVGATQAVDFFFFEPGGTDPMLSVLYPNLCLMQSFGVDLPLEGCPGGCVSGTVYRECQSLPYTNQIPLEGWTVNLVDAQNNVVGSTVSDNSGAYSICDLAPGQYAVKTAALAGWKASLPPAGQWTVQVAAAGNYTRDFGYCPPCSCDSIDMFISQEGSGTDTSTYYLTLFALDELCFQQFTITIDTGQIIDFAADLPGWIIERIGNTLVLTAPTFLSAKHYPPCHFRLAGTGNHVITVSTTYDNGMSQVACEQSFTYPNPPVEILGGCCPSGTKPGPELVLNGDFDNSGGFISGYSNNCSGQIEGQYCITTDASKVNPGFSACADLTGAGNIFVANGALTLNTDVLCYSFNSLTPNTNYIFSFYHASVSGASPAILGVYFGGTQTGGIAVLSVNACAWKKYCFVWNSGNNTAITVCIRNLNTQAQGNDFAIDKVSFKECSKCAPLPSGAVLWMPMDEVGGESGIKSIAGGLFAISSFGVIGAGGPTPVPGKVDATPPTFGYGALQFSNTGATSVSNDPTLNFAGGPFTIDAWVKDNSGTQTGPVVVKMDNQGGYAFSITGTPTTRQPTLSLRTNAGVEVFQGPPIAIGQWNFVAVAVNPPAVTFYVGGATSFASSTHTLSGAPSIATSSSPLHVGYNPLNPGAHHDIMIDELEIFNTALTAQQLNQIWAADDKGKCRSLCQCGGFSKLFVRNTKGSLNQPVSCSGATVNLPCEPGLGYHLTGVFHCDGDECAPDHTITWNLSGPGGSQSGTFTDNDPFFGMHLLPNWFGQPGTYTLKMSGDCGVQTCSCEIKFQINCPNLCPCDNQSVQAFHKNVGKGFATAISLNSCTACFSPLALSDCETVEWYLNSPGGPYLGITYGKQTFCHTFAGPGNYTVVMQATRTQPDGSLCVDDSYTRTVSLSCSGIPDCPDSILPNPKFSQNSGAGILDSIPGWKGRHWGDPHENLNGRVVETGNSQDGWVVAITGDYIGGTILDMEAPLCVSKSDSGMLVITMRTPGEPIPGAAVNVGRKPPGGNNTIMFYTSNVTPTPDCQDANCYPLAVLEGLLPFEEDAWYELQIPYNLADWAALDSCGDQAGGIPARMAFYVSNLLSEEQQSAGLVNEGILIDQICFRGMTVSANDATQGLPLRLYPNPTTGNATLEWTAGSPKNARLILADATGRFIRNAAIPDGARSMPVRLDDLQPGLYFIQILSAERLYGVVKVVKR